MYDIAILLFTPSSSFWRIWRINCFVVRWYRLTHCGRETHICVDKLTIIGSDNGLSPGRRQAIIWTNAGILLIGPLGTNFSEIVFEIYIFSFKKMRLKVSSGKWRLFCLGLNELRTWTAQKQKISYTYIYNQMVLNHCLVMPQTSLSDMILIYIYLA